MINTATNIVAATVTVGMGPTGVAITPDGAVAYVTNYSSNTVSVIQTSNNTVVHTVTVGNNRFGVAMTPDGAVAYVTNYSFIGVAGTVSVIQISNNTVVDTISGVGPGPFGVAITPQQCREDDDEGDGHGDKGSDSYFSMHHRHHRRCKSGEKDSQDSGGLH